MNRLTRVVLGAMVAAMGLAVGIGGPAHALELVTNGSFETGNFTGWTLSGRRSSEDGRGEQGRGR